MSTNVVWLIIGALGFVALLIFLSKSSRDRWRFDNGPWTHNQVDYDGETPDEIRAQVPTRGEQNPVLDFSSRHRYLVPSSWRDPIYPPPSAGPNGGGPRVGKPQNVPLKQIYSKSSNEYYKAPFYNSGGTAFPSSTLFVNAARGGSQLDSLGRPQSQDYFRPYGPNPVLEQSVPFFSSVSAYAPFPELGGPWEKVGLLTKASAGSEHAANDLMNLYRSPIAPLQDLWQYQVQDKNGFVIPLAKYTFLEEDQKIPEIVGKGGPWVVHLYNQNKYILM